MDQELPASALSTRPFRHAVRVRCCQDCLSGEHDIDTDTWRTEFLRLERRSCVCGDCDCTFHQARVRDPRFDQRHYEPYPQRKRRRHAA